jgi:hypothetical protein
LNGERFEPETTRLLGIVFEMAIAALHTQERLCMSTHRFTGSSLVPHCETHFPCSA